MGLTWGVAGFVLGVAIEVVHNVWPNPVGAAVDIWPAALVYPGLLGGVAFAVVLGVAGRGRRLEELSLPRTAVWGAAGGLLVSLVPAILTLLGLATANVPIGELTALLAGPFMLGGAAAAAASVALARAGEGGARDEMARDVEEAGLTPEEARELLGDG